MDCFTYQTDGRVCSSKIDIEVEDGIVKKAEFTGGCPGNLAAVNQLVRGRKVEDVIALLKGIPCGGKPTSCPDQLACALQSYLEGKNVAKSS